MPLNLESIVKNDKLQDIFLWIVQSGMENPQSVYMTDDKRVIYVRNDLYDEFTMQIIGRIVSTLVVKEDQIEIKDMDIVWNNHNLTVIEPQNHVIEDDEEDEYYEVEVNDHHCTVVAINRFTKENILNMKHEVSISVLPFSLLISESLDELNHIIGMNKTITIDEMECKIDGFSDDFMMSNGIFNSNDASSSLIGKVLSFKDVKVVFGDVDCEFVIAQVETGLGIVPVSMSKDIFDLEKLKEGSYLFIQAMVKADFAKSDVFNEV